MTPSTHHNPESPGLAGLADSLRTDRRTFVKRASVAIGALGAASACSSEVVTPLLEPGSASLADISLGTGDVGILNYAFALEQLEARFYEMVVTTRYAGMSDYEYRVFLDIRDHEIVHREFLRAALGSSGIGNVSLNFSAVDFSSRASVLNTARTFEDLGVAAYNGAGQLLNSADFLTAAGKIVSVEARHASAVRLMISLFMDNAGYSRASVGDGLVDAQGLDRAMTPAQVLTAAAPFFNDRLIATGLPTA